MLKIPMATSSTSVHKPIPFKFCDQLSYLGRHTGFSSLPILLPIDLVQLPFIEHLGTYGVRFILPADDKSRLLCVIRVLDVAEDQYPSGVEKAVQLSPGRGFGGSASLFNAHSHFPVFCSALILRFASWRFNAVIRSRNTMPSQ